MLTLTESSHSFSVCFILCLGDNMRGCGGKSWPQGILNDVRHMRRHRVEGLLNTEVSGEGCRS